MVYVIGVGHTVQWDKKLSWKETIEFIAELEQLVIDLNIRLIAEEYSVEVVIREGIQSSTTKDIADKLKIPHRYCDPDKIERAKIHYFSKNDDPIRLEYWLSKILDKILDPIIFVCGNDHKEEFASLVREKGYDTTVICKTFITSRDL
ncbi:MAG: hypothetical protein WC069_00645 [Candidatus Shapirobacteria bacterium]